jgi:hypothetical protein
MKCQDEQEMNMANGLDRDETGFGTRSGLIYRNTDANGDTVGWFYFIGSEHTRGPYSSKAKAVASRNRQLRSLDRRDYLLGK